MTLKKKIFNDNEELLFDDAVVYKRGDYWQCRLWLSKEGKYARFSLKTRNKDTAIDKAKKHYYELKAGEATGKRYFSQTTKIGVENYLAEREKEIGTHIVVGRYRTIKTHLEHWLDVIGRDVKLKELERTDCENYFLERRKGKKSHQISQSTIANEQATINALMKWLYKRGETYIDGFDFKKLPRVDTGAEENRRNTFTDAEAMSIASALSHYIKEAEKDLDNNTCLVQAVTAYYLGISLISGLRRGEQLQLRWCDIADMEHGIARANKFDLVRITVRGSTSKVGKTRKFVVKDTRNYFAGIFRIAKRLRFDGAVSDVEAIKQLNESLIFSVNGKSAITARAIAYHFDKLLDNAKISRGNRDLVPYSFRHYFITQRVNSNLPPAAVAEMCGTSIAQIEKTYYHTTEEKMVSNALADYEYVDGMLVPK